MDDDVDPLATGGRTGNAPRSARGPCSSASPNRPRFSRPSTNWGGRPPAPGSRAAITSAVAVRNGPPLAVRMILATSSLRLPARHWKIALCSLSTGSRVAPLDCAASVISSPAVTSASLLASATVLPASTAAMTGRSPAQPTIAAIDQIGLARRGLDQASLARRRAATSAGERVREARASGFVGDHRQLRRQSAGQFRQAPRRSSPRSPRRPRTDPAIALDQVERRLADRAGRAEDCDLARHVSPSQLRRGGKHSNRHQPVEPVEHAAVARQPGAESLTPARRFIAAFEQVARLRRRGENGASTSSGKPSPVASDPGAAKQGRRRDAAVEALDRLAGADRRRELAPPKRRPAK